MLSYDRQFIDTGCFEHRETMILRSPFYIGVVVYPLRHYLTEIWNGSDPDNGPQDTAETNQAIA